MKNKKYLIIGGVILLLIVGIITGIYIYSNSNLKSNNLTPIATLGENEEPFISKLLPLLLSE